MVKSCRELTSGARTQPQSDRGLILVSPKPHHSISSCTSALSRKTQFQCMVRLSCCCPHTLLKLNQTSSFVGQTSTPTGQTPATGNQKVNLPSPCFSAGFFRALLLTRTLRLLSRSRRLLVFETSRERVRPCCLGLFSQLTPSWTTRIIVR